MSTIMDPIQQLTKKGVDVAATWDPKVHGIALEALKMALTTAPILKIPDISRPFRIEVDACRVGRGIGAILLQEDDEGVMRPCAYYSRALTATERRYSATELEALALHNTILHWKVYLRNHHEFTAVVDHYALVYMVTKMGTEQQNQRLQRLCLDLQGFRFRVVHQAGVKHIGADAVSRLLRNDEEPYMRDEDALRDDWGPLTEREKKQLEFEFSEDAQMLIQTINEKRDELRQQAAQHELDRVWVEAAVPTVPHGNDEATKVQILCNNIRCGCRDSKAAHISQYCAAEWDAEIEKNWNLLDGDTKADLLAWTTQPGGTRFSQGDEHLYRDPGPISKEWEMFQEEERLADEWGAYSSSDSLGESSESDQSDIDDIPSGEQRDWWSEFPTTPVELHTSHIRSTSNSNKGYHQRSTSPAIMRERPTTPIPVERHVSASLSRPGYTGHRPHPTREERERTEAYEAKETEKERQQTAGDMKRRNLQLSLCQRITDHERALNVAKAAKMACTKQWDRYPASTRERELYNMERAQLTRKETVIRASLQRAKQMYENAAIEDMQARKDYVNQHARPNPYRGRLRADLGKELSAAEYQKIYHGAVRAISRPPIQPRTKQELDKIYEPLPAGEWGDRRRTAAQERALETAEAYYRATHMGSKKPAVTITEPKAPTDRSRGRSSSRDRSSTPRSNPTDRSRGRASSRDRSNTPGCNATNNSRGRSTSCERWESRGRSSTPSRTGAEARVEAETRLQFKYHVGKKVGSISTATLEKVLQSRAISEISEEIIREELARRKATVEDPGYASMSTKALWELCERIMASMKRRDGNETQRKEEEKVLGVIENELYQRDLAKENGAPLGGTHQRPPQESTYQRPHITNGRDYVRGLERQLMELKAQNTNSQERHQALLRASEQIITKIHQRLSDMSAQMDSDIAELIAEKKEANDERVYLHMIDSRKAVLEANMRPRSQMTPVEAAQQQARALEQQRKAQALTMKRQQKKTELLAKMQNNTVARLQKMNQLEKELKALAVRQAQAENDEFINEEVELAIDRKIEENGDFLIGQYYMGVGTQQLYQVIDVVVDKKQKPWRLTTVARPIDTIERGVELQSERQRLPVHGTGGAAELIAQFEQGKKDYDDIPLPRTSAEWLALQKDDAHIMELLNKLGNTPNAILPMDHKPVNESEDYLYREVSDRIDLRGVLMRRSVKERLLELRDITARVQQEYRQVVVPDSMKEKLIWIMHDQMGHPGRNRTTETLKLKYHWSGMYTDVMNYCKGCRYCNLRKAHNRVAKVPIMVYNFAERPNSRVHMDLAGPFPLANNGGYYIEVLKDALTKWITLVPIHCKDMYTVNKQYIEQWTSIYGAPDVLITDRGTEFHNILAKQLAELWGVRKIATTPSNPRSDGQAENQMRTLKDMLASFVKRNQTDWDEYLPLVAQAYNTTVNTATGMTPYFLMYGREMNMAAEDHTMTMEVQDFHEMVVKVKEIQQWYWTYTGERVVKNSEAMNRVPAERLTYKPYRVGDFFYHRVVPKRAYKSDNEERAEKISSKLQFRYVGPYMVTEVISPVVFGTTIHGKNKRVHALNMKPANTGRKDTSRKGLPVRVEEQPGDH